MIIPETEFKEKADSHLNHSSREPGSRIREGNIISPVSGITEQHEDSFTSMKGIIPDNGLTLEDYKEERLSKFL